MKIKSITLILILIFSISIASSAQKLLPTSTTGQIVRHTYFTLSYSEKDEQPEWVYYELTPTLIKGKQKRTDDYRPDSLVSTISAQLEDYSRCARYEKIIQAKVGLTGCLVTYKGQQLSQ